MLRALTDINCVWLRAHPETPLLYRSGVRYRLDARGTEVYKDIPHVLRDKVGDCKKLAAWRAAELIVRYGTEAKALPVLQSVASANGQEVVLVHVIVQYPDGLTEDPSRILGMR